MAIRPSVGTVSFMNKNVSGKALLQHPTTFPDVTPTSHYSWSIWVYARNSGIPTTLSMHVGVDGSLVHVGHDGFKWGFFTRSAGVVNFVEYATPVAFDQWSLLCFTQDGPELKLYVGIENFSPEGTGTIPQLVLTASPALNFQMDYFKLFIGPSQGICNFKFWNSSLSQLELFNQANSFAREVGVGPIPFWVSPFRIIGDLTNVAYPFAGPPWTWTYGHYWDEILNVPNLVFIPDPVTLVDTECNAWILPVEPGVAPGDTFPDIGVDVGLTPLVPTMYKALKYYKFGNFGAVPPDQTIVNIKYYAFPTIGPDVGAPASEYWGLFKDENGAEVNNTGDPIYQFPTPPFPTHEIANGFIEIPGPINAVTMYQWQFGGQFLWNPVAPPQQETASAHLTTIFLYVTYIGMLDGLIPLPVNDMMGLFSVNKGGPNVDRYNNNAELKIPNPTVRTAYIGE